MSVSVRSKPRHHVASDQRLVSPLSDALRLLLPSGDGLAPDAWRRRHLAVVTLLWTHFIAFVVAGTIVGDGVLHSAAEAALVGLAAYAAQIHAFSKRVRSTIASAGLITASAVLVHLSGGMIEMHFHFFVALAVIALYQSWSPFLVAVAYVVIHHGGIGVLAPQAVYNHPDAIAHPWRWAAIHGAFVAAACTASMVNWRLSEHARADEQKARQAAERAEAALSIRAQQQAAVALLGQRVLVKTVLNDVFADAVAVVADTLAVDFSAVLELMPDGSHLVIRAQVGMPNLTASDQLVSAGIDSHAGYTLHVAEPVVVNDLQSEQRFMPTRVMLDRGIVSCVSVIIQGTDGPYGILGAYASRQRGFSQDDVHFLQAVANVLGASIERDAIQRQLAHSAFHDSLTGLPNRVLCLDRLAHALAHTRHHDTVVAVLFLDLDNFKVINDSLGHDAGDHVLIEVAARISACLRPADTAARLGGDEFTILLEDIRDITEVVAVADRIAGKLQAPITVRGHEFVPTASIGIAVSESADDIAEDLLRQADIAMYRVKASGKAHHQIFDPSMNLHVMARLELEQQLRYAIERGELRVYYQPKVILESDQMTSLEALVRWEHPELGLIGPVDFVPLAEETGLIIQIGEWVLGEACRQVRDWNAAYCPDAPLAVSVNLSARQFQQADLAERIQKILRETELDAHLLALEITESVVMDDAPATIRTLAALKGLGVQLMIDDFGTGYSSLSYLKRFPVDVLKIDRSFTQGLPGDPDDTVIVAGIVSLAHALGLRVVAEGIETTDQRNHLTAIGCDLGQGYRFSKPLPAEEAGRLVAIQAVAARPVELAR